VAGTQPREPGSTAHGELAQGRLLGFGVQVDTHVRGGATGRVADKAAQPLAAAQDSSGPAEAACGLTTPADGVSASTTAPIGTPTILFATLK